MDIRKISIFALTLQAGTVLCILCNHCALPFCHRAFDLQLFREFEVSLRSPLACSLTTLIQHVSVPVRSCQRFCQLLPNTQAPSNPNGGPYRRGADCIVLPFAAPFLRCWGWIHRYNAFFEPPDIVGPIAAAYQWSLSSTLSGPLTLACGRRTVLYWWRHPLFSYCARFRQTVPSSGYRISSFLPFILLQFICLCKTGCLPTNETWSCDFQQNTVIVQQSTDTVGRLFNLHGIAYMCFGTDEVRQVLSVQFKPVETLPVYRIVGSIVLFVASNEQLNCLLHLLHGLLWHGIDSQDWARC